jgi:hypothetical protein
MTEKTSRHKTRQTHQPPEASGTYEIGYGRTPMLTRFQPGRSGNPRGRPKGLKSIGKLLSEALARRVKVQDNSGGQRTLRLQDVIVQGLVNDAARRDASALKLLFALMDRYRDGHDQEVDAAQMQPDDIAIIDSFLASMKAQETCAPPNDKNNEGRGSPASPEMKAPPDRADGDQR